VLAIIGAAFSVIFMVLQLIPIPGLGINFCDESYLMFGVWVALGLVFYIFQRKKINAKPLEEESVEESEANE
jgi:hypothetical protein